VRSIHRVDDCWRIIVNPVDRQEVIEAEEIVLAVPPHHASELLAHISPPAANDLGLIGLSSMAIVTLAYPADSVAPMSGSGFLVPPSEHRTLKAANYATSKWDWIAREAGTRRHGDDGLVLIRASVGRLGEEDAVDRDDAQLVADVHSELSEAVGISAPPVDNLVTRWRDAIPQYATGHVRRVERIRSVVAGVEGLEICGAAFDGVGVASVIGSARTAARGVLQRAEVESARVGH
jgi:oxygen-dependent protoporphyrinogen oxidase